MSLNASGEVVFFIIFFFPYFYYIFLRFLLTHFPCYLYLVCIFYPWPPHVQKLLLAIIHIQVPIYLLNPKEILPKVRLLILFFLQNMWSTFIVVGDSPPPLSPPSSRIFCLLRFNWTKNQYLCFPSQKCLSFDVLRVNVKKDVLHTKLMKQPMNWCFHLFATPTVGIISRKIGERTKSVCLYIHNE